MLRPRNSHTSHTRQGGLWTVGQAIEAQFDRIDSDLSHVRPRQINEYNQIVWLTKLLKGVRS